MERFRPSGPMAARFAVGVFALVAIPAEARAQSCIQQKSLPDGCHQTGGSIGCTPAANIGNLPHRVDLSPDDETAYVAGGSLTVFDRDTSDGTLTQLAGASGCINDTGAGGCTDARSFGSGTKVAFTSDSATAYVASFAGPTVFDRNLGTGALTQKAGTAGCVNATGAETCSVGVEVFGTSHVALSPGPTHAHFYAVSIEEDAITVFDRNAVTGALTQKAGGAGCINETGSDGCTDGKGLLGAIFVIVSPDGANVYVISSESSAIAVFDRDPMTGVLTQKAGLAGCISEDGSAGECTDGSMLALVTAAAISPDGKNLYAVAGLTGSSRALTIFDRDPMTGVLTQKPGPSGCVTTSGSGGLCINGRGFTSPRGVAVSPDGLSVYMADEDSDGISAYVRDPATGLLSQPAGTTGCATLTGNEGCGAAVGMEDGLGVTVSSDGNNVYSTASDDLSPSVAVFDRVECPPTTTTTSSTTTTSTTTSTTMPTTTSTTTTSTTSTTTSTTSTTTSTTSTTSTTLPEPAEACGEAALAACRDQAGVARLRMRNVGTPVSPTVEFVWKLGEMTSVDALGDPTDATTYSLCVYAAGSRVLDLSVPPGARWTAGTKRRFRYYDGTGTADGVRKLVLQAGDTGEAKVRLRARGVNLDFPALPLTAPLRVQLVGDDGGGLECWEAEFPTIGTNTDIKVDAQQ